MNKQEALEQIERMKNAIDTADKLCQKIDPLLPKGWKSYLQSDNLFNLWFAGNSGGKNTFKKVCSLVAQATGCKITREIRLIDKNLPYLWGQTHYKGLTIYINQDDVSSCEFTITKKRQIQYEITTDCLQTIGA